LNIADYKRRSISADLEAVLSVIAGHQYFPCHPAIECIHSPERAVGTDLDAAVASDACIIIKSVLFSTITILFEIYPGKKFGR
jgi:hypothetical protein